MEYLVYDSTDGTETARPVLRWGTAPDSQIAIQATAAGEVAVAVPGFRPGEVEYGGYIYNQTTGETNFIGSPPPSPGTFYNPDIVSAVDRMNALLRGSDWTQIADAGLTAQQVADWATYRASVRAVPEQAGFPSSITWPAAPGDFQEVTYDMV